MLENGRLCEKGLIKEFFNEKINDLDYFITESGIQKVNEILKDSKYQLVFLKLTISDAINSIKKNQPEQALNELVFALKKINEVQNMPKSTQENLS